MPTLAFRVRVRNETNTADLVTWTMDDLSTAPSGDGTEINIATGQTRSGSYTVRLADRLVSGTARTGTRWLADAGGKNRLLSRRAFVERQENGGGWLVMIPGYITRVAYPDAATVDVQIGESLRVPATARAFSAVTASSVRAAILGGPMAGDWGPLRASVGWSMKVTAVGGSLYARLVTMVPTVGAVPPTFTVGPVTRAMQDTVNRLASPAIAARGAPFAEQVFANQSQHAWRVSLLTTSLTPIFGGTVVTATPVVVDLATQYDNQPALLRFGENGTAVGFAVDWPAGVSLPTVGDTYATRVTYVAPSEQSPIYYDTHPITIASELYTAAGVDIDASSFATCLTDLGAQLRLAVRITDATPLQAWIETNIAGPLGVTFLPDTLGRIAARFVRRTLEALPAATITLADLSAIGSVWELEEGSAVARIAWTQRQFVQGADPDAVDGILAQEQIDTRDIGDQTTYATQVLSYTVAGMYHSAGTWSAVNQVAATGGLVALAGRYSRGAATVEYVGMRSSATIAALAIGDYVQCNVPSLPVGNVRIGDVGGTPARVMQVLRITERPATRELLLEDAGPTNNPFSTVPTLSLSTATAGGEVSASVTVTNAATLNTALAALAIQIAFTSGAAPASTDWDYLYAVLPIVGIPTTAIVFQLQARDTTVWFRARATTGSELPSGWSTSVSAALATVAGVTSFAAAAITGNSMALALTWARATNDGAVFDIEARTSTETYAPRLTAIPASLAATVGNLVASTSYDVRIRARVQATGQISAWSTATQTTDSAGATVADPTSVQIASDGAGMFSVQAVVTGTPLPALLAEFAVETGVGAGTFGSYVAMGSATADATSGVGLVSSFAPNDGLKRRVRVRASSAIGVSAYVVAAPDATPFTTQQTTGIGAGAVPSFGTVTVTVPVGAPNQIKVTFAGINAPVGASYALDYLNDGAADYKDAIVSNSTVIALGRSVSGGGFAVAQVLRGTILMLDSARLVVTSKSVTPTNYFGA